MRFDCVFFLAIGLLIQEATGQCLPHDAPPPVCKNWVNTDNGHPVFMQHQFNCSRFWVCNPDLTDCLHECPKANADSNLFFDFTIDFDHGGPVCNWPWNVNCVFKPEICNKCEAWQECVECETCDDGWKCTPECKLDVHCDGDEYCDFEEGGEGNCIKGCRNGSDCGVNNSEECGICENHVCNEPECCVDQDCHDGVCIDGTCQGCANDGDCTMTACSTCVNNECYNPHCCSDDDCASDHYCDNGECKEGCNEDSDCSKNGSCAVCGDDNQCTQPECCADNECTSNAACSVCQDDFTCTVPECCSDDDCSEDQYCDNTECKNGCNEDSDCSKFGSCAVCEADNQCSQPECCANADCTNAVCAMCQNDLTCTEPECCTDDDCSEDQYCDNTECKNGCNENSDCAKFGSCSVCGDDNQCTQPECCSDSECTNMSCAECQDDFTCSVPECCVDSDCPSDLPLCDANECVSGCRQDEDCDMWNGFCNGNYTVDGSTCFYCSFDSGHHIGSCDPGCSDNDNCQEPNPECDGRHHCIAEGTNSVLTAIEFATEDCVGCSETEEGGPMLHLVGEESLSGSPSCTTDSLDHEGQVDFGAGSEVTFEGEEDRDLLGTCYLSNLQNAVTEGTITWTGQGTLILKNGQVNFYWTDVNACPYTCCIASGLNSGEVNSFDRCFKNCGGASC